MKTSLERRILIFSLLALTLTVAINTLFNVESFRRSYRNGILQRSETFAAALKAQVEAVVNLGLPLAEIAGISERCQDIVVNDPEISYCLIEGSSGDVLYHSLGEYPLITEVVYIGNLSPDVSILDSKVMGEIYDFAQPIYDYNDNVVGRVRIGFQAEVLRDLVVAHLTSTAMVLAAAFAVVFALIVVFFRYDLVLPIRRLCDMAEHLAAGQFGTRPPLLRTRELAMLGSTLSDMGRSLSERDAQLTRNFEELEEANLELQRSYENLESLSSELGRSREMYRSLLEEASDAILVCDEGDTIVIANKAAERFFGLPKARMERCNYFSFLDMIKCRDVEAQFELHQSTRTKLSSKSEIRFWSEASQRRLLGQASTSVVVDKDGRHLVQIIIRDATKEEEIRQGLERTATEMERLNQMKNSFLGLASHELKTPLTIILGYVELLLSEREVPIDEDTLALIRHIAKASDRLAEIVRDMVDISLIDGRTIDLVSQEVDVNVLVQRAVDLSEAHLLQRQQLLKLDLAKDLPLVKCDTERMVQAIGNVLGNAIKFTPDKGNIAVKTRLVSRPRLPEMFANGGIDGTCEISAEPLPYIEITICDKGIGIAASEQEAIFDKFYEIGDVEEHSSGKVAFKSRGTGLGLSIVKGIVSLHSGAVWAESPGCDPATMPGSTFFILLPAAELLTESYAETVPSAGKVYWNQRRAVVAKG